MTAPEAVLDLRGVTKEYPGTPPVRALRGIDLTIRSGELVGVVGPSGSGKSTLLHVMGTLDRPTAGDVHVAGYDISRLSDRDLSAVRARNIGFVFQQFHLLDGYTALDNVADGLLYTGMSAADRRDLAADTLGRVGLAHRVTHATSKLSGGERQRVAVARAVLGRPAIVLADEPTGNLDSTSSDAIVELLEELNAEGITLVVITHNPEIAARFPRQVSLLDGLVESDSAAAGVGR
ncbi:MAG: ABC transporter ATP-binding protein [Actinobacteria bacterium]|nr:ABC transporter ATP-binding protein [Actinomycetota bacterium]